MISTLPVQVGRRAVPQLLVHERHEFVLRGGIAVSPRTKETGHLARSLSHGVASARNLLIGRECRPGERSQQADSRRACWRRIPPFPGATVVESWPDSQEVRMRK